VSSRLDIINLALGMLGASPIANLTDPNNKSRIMTITYDPVRLAELRRHRWKFSIVRANLPALATPPVNGIYETAYQLPADCLRVLNVGQWDPGQDISDYRFRSVAEYSIESGMILTDQASPLPIRYVTNSNTEGQFDSAFTMMLAARLAWQNCETITQSGEKRQMAMAEYKTARDEAIRANALESPPEFKDDDSWVTARVS